MNKMSNNTQQLIDEAVERFEKEFGFKLHEMVDGDWCPTLGVPNYNPFNDTSSAKPQKPNYTVKQLQEKCLCGGDEKIEEIKSFLKSELTTIASESAENKEIKNWYYEGDELVITKGKWVIDRYKRNHYE